MKSIGRVSTPLLIALFCLLSMGAASGQDLRPNSIASTGESVTYQINPTHTGAIQIKGLLPPLSLKWSVDLGAPVSYPLIAAGRVFVLAGPDHLSNVNLYALDAATGAIVWGPVLIPEGTTWWAAAAYENGKVFVVPDSSSPFGEGAMLAFNGTTGAQLWSVTLSGQSLFNSPPTALGGLVYTSGTGAGGTLYAVEESNGSTLWTASVENGTSSSPVVTSTGVYVSYVCPQVYEFSPTSGAQIWHFNGPCNGQGGATPALFKGSLFVRDSLINGNTGAILKASNGTVTGYFNSQFAPAFLGTTVIYTQIGTLTAVNLTTGATEWTAVPSSGDTFSSPPIVVNNVVYIGTALGNLEGFNVQSGASVLTMNMGAPIAAYDADSYTTPLSGLGAGDGMIVVPASNLVVALKH